tara:strand:- start:183 stop:494 length:312 start_codon:yes stop_codon:yes gene_type:complete
MKSKQKGNKFERECVNKAKEYGLKSKRAWGSDGRSLGLESDVDMLIENSKHRYKAQCKIRKRIASWVKVPESCDITLVRENRGDTFVVIHYEDFLKLLTKKSN